MRRGRRAQHHGSNPFVVLTDVTVSLAIIFLVFGIGTALANNQLLLFFDRNDRQEAIKKQLLEAVGRVLPQATPTSDATQRNPQTHIIFKDKDKVVAEVWHNSSFQRVSLYEEMYAPNSSELTALGTTFVREMGAVARNNARQFMYLFINGIAEQAEASRLPEAEEVKLSQDRAWGVRQALIQQGVIGSGGVDPRFAIPYGVGSKLYSTGTSRSGRVDLVLFYSDVGDTKGVATGVSG